ncbi:Detected protein of confused Function [Hibiscus syriacus]|uniref:Detected protein of confused Function n=1 Tax=Hibiscus syriacus TaxID=106335 RepID=A0A6A3CK57_HIBSY|nr:Detected protein of confused Function [Hibiscus syriacus]
MAFHVACPITCGRICFCSLGFPRNLQSTNSKKGFLQEVTQLEAFFKDPWGVRVAREGTVQVPVPKVAPVPAGDGGGGADTAEESAQAKRLALQGKAAAAMVAAEDYARRVESGDITVASKSSAVDEQGQSNTNVMCHMCFLGENEASERARRMLSCRNCGKKYHRSCVKSWAKHRDLFHWISWTCLTVEPVRCVEVLEIQLDSCSAKDVMVHIIATANILHIRMFLLGHICAQNIQGVTAVDPMWFLGYTCCDACGRLFVKGNYCPVYRDSESTPMVCCDVCQRWVHCHCDGIRLRSSFINSNEFIPYDNLQYKCATCRGECYQVTDLEDAVRELWERRDIADQDLIARLRAAAGLPTQEDIFLSLRIQMMRKMDIQYQGYSLAEDRNNEVASQMNEEQNIFSSVAGVQDANQHRIDDKFLESHDSTAKSGGVDGVDRSTKSKVGAANSSDGHGIVPLEHTRVALGKGNVDGNRLSAAPSGDVFTLRGGKVVSGKQLEDRDDMYGESSEDYGHTPILNSLPKYPKPTLKFKVKKPVLDNQNPQTLDSEARSQNLILICFEIEQAGTRELLRAVSRAHPHYLSG